MPSSSASTVCAVVVLYLPTAEMLQCLLAGVREQVERLYVVDNTTFRGDEPSPVEQGPWLTYTRLNQNKGLAAAQNIGLRQAMQDGFTHVLLLDQDSELAPGMVAGLLNAERFLVEQGHQVAAVGAMYIDVKTNLPAPAHRYRPFHLQKVRVPVGSPPIETDWLIASGSMIRSNVFQHVGLMREELFIDVVDTEWGLRARSMGWTSYLVPAVTMAHNIGDATAKLMGRTLLLHSELRACYMIRNNAYLLREPAMGWRWRSYTPLNLLLSFITSIMFARHRLRRLQLALRALLLGFLGRLGPLPGS